MPETHGHVEHDPAAPPAPDDAELDRMMADAIAVGHARAQLAAALSPPPGHIQAASARFPTAQEVVEVDRAANMAEDLLLAAIRSRGVEVHVARLISEVRALRRQLAAKGG